MELSCGPTPTPADNGFAARNQARFARKGSAKSSARSQNAQRLNKPLDCNKEFILVKGFLMEDTQNIIASLELFNEKANKLLNSSFVQALLSPDSGVTISGRKKNDDSFAVRTEVFGPSQESIDAFVLTFRFFIQDNESTALRNIANIYENASIDQEFLERFYSARVATNQLLDSPNMFNITYNDITPTNRDVMETFIYGGLVHANPEKYKQFKEWMGFPPASGLFQACFTSVLGHVLSAIGFIANLNREVLFVINTSVRDDV